MSKRVPKGTFKGTKAEVIDDSEEDVDYGEYGEEEYGEEEEGLQDEEDILFAS